jgi:transcriptional regulator CtsR
MAGGLYKVELSTSAIARHLEQQKAGHGYNKDGKIELSKHQNHASILAHIQQAHKLNIPQDAANVIAQLFFRDDFL